MASDTPAPKRARVSSETPALEDGGQLIIVANDHFCPIFWEKCMLPQSRYSQADYVICDCSTGSWQDKFERVLAMIRKYGSKSRVLAITEVGMSLYSAALETLQGEFNLAGGSFICFSLSNMKLATRQLISGCGGIEVRGVYGTEECLPKLEKDGFFKPLGGVSAQGVFMYKAGTTPKNPCYGQKNDMSVEPVLKKLGEAHDDLLPYMDENLVAIVEEYVPPEGRHIVSLDGCVHEKKIHHYAMSDNIYKGNGAFDYLVTPTQKYKPGDAVWERAWELFDELVGDMITRGLNNQFIDYEAFVFPDGRVEVMEVNCRCFSNQLPIFQRLFGAGCMMDTSIDLLVGAEPTFAGAMPDAGGKVGVAIYCDYVDKAPKFVESEDKSTFYYSSGPKYHDQAHIYSVGSDGQMAGKQKCDDLHKEILAKYS